jgi:hypothetical protein
MNLGVVSDLSVRSQTPITSITAAGWLDTDDIADQITAPYLGALKITGNKRAGLAGDFQADLDLGLSGGTALALNSLSVAGILSGSTITVSGHDSKGVSVGTFRVGRVDDATVVADGGVDSISSSQWEAGSITAGWVGSIGIKINAAIGGHGDFGPYMVLSGVAVPLKKATLGSVNIAGDLLNGSQWDVRTGNVGSVTVSGTVEHSLIRSAGDITSIKLGASSGSDFGAGVAFGLLQSDRHVALGDAVNAPTGTIRIFTVSGLMVAPRQPIPQFFVDSNISAKVGTVNMLNWDGLGGLFTSTGSTNTRLLRYKDTDRLPDNWAWPNDFLHII